MRTLTEKYNGVLKGLFSKDQFLRDARMEQSHLVTQYNSYNDAVNILLNKGLIHESVGAEKFLDSLFALANDELRVGRITQDEYDYVLSQIDKKEYDLLLLGNNPDQVFDKLLMQAQSEMGTMSAESSYEGVDEVESEENLEEGPAKNNPKIEKLVAGINDLIAQAVDSDGDPIGVVDPTSTWEEPYVYEPIQYKNGQLKIVSKSPYQKTSDVDIILSRNMEFDGIPTLRLIMRMYKKAIKQAGKMSNLGQEIEEKKLTPAEKAGKEKIVKGLKKSGMSAKDPSTYAIATSVAKDLYEGFEEVNGAYSDILKLYNDHYRQLSQVSEDDAYALHELLKSYFNRLFEGTIEEAMIDVKRNDKLEHIPSGTTFTVSVATKTRISGFITVGGTVKGRDYRVHDLIAIRPIEVGAVWKKLPSEEPAITYSNLAEAKEEGYKSPKAELPLDVLHHGIRFELDKKEIGNTPTEEEYLKAYKSAAKNLEKDLLHYKKEEGAVEAPSSKSDEMVKVKLKEGFKNIIRNILSENTSNKKAFNLNGKPL